MKRDIDVWMPTALAVLVNIVLIAGIILIVCAACSRDSTRLRPIIGYENFQPTELSSARRKRHRVVRVKIVETPAEDPPVKTIKTISIPVEPENDDPLLSSYWPDLEVEALPEAIIIASAPVILPDLRAWTDTPSGKGAIIGLTLMILLALSGATVAGIRRPQRRLASLA